MRQVRSVWVQEFLLDRNHELIRTLAHTNAPEDRTPILDRLLINDALTVLVAHRNLDAQAFVELLRSVSLGNETIPHANVPPAMDEAAELLRRWPQWIERAA